MGLMSHNWWFEVKKDELLEGEKGGIGEFPANCLFYSMKEFVS